MQNVIMTGGSRGLGLAVTRTLAAAYHRITGTTLTIDAGNTA